jgi:hypothetical protein
MVRAKQYGRYLLRANRQPNFRCFFLDAANGTVARVPWAQGMDLLGGAQAAKVQVAMRAIQVIRAGKIVPRLAKPQVSLPLEAGDVVRVGEVG